MNSNTSRSSFIDRHPWWFVIAAFALLLGAWSSLIAVAVRNRPEMVETRR
ncbi:hypothetical protein [Luteolibacter sp. LG18]|nr:hypothetical protein llg_32340 [Luteolibacter sp. LG18]